MTLVEQLLINGTRYFQNYVEPLVSRGSHTSILSHLTDKPGYSKLHEFLLKCCV